MPPENTPNLIDGLATVRAVRHAKAHKKGKKPTRERAAKPAPPKRASAPGARPVRIGHTAMPRRIEIVCYKCGYSFVVTGHLYNTFCPKCKEQLEIENHDLEGQWSGDLKTIGTVRIATGAVLTDATIVGGDVVVEGDIRAARITVCRALELCAGARFNPARIDMKDVRIREGAQITTKRKFSCRNLDVHGQINARVFADGLITVHPGGCLSGKVYGAHLVVQDGGGLKAEMAIAPGK